MVDLPRPILAVVYTDGIVADRFLADLGYSLRESGLLVAGLVQLNSFVRDPIKCDMEIEELSSGTVLQLSEHRGKEARGCRLDRSVLAEAAVLLNRALDRKPEVLVLNKFGKTEAEGGGVRDVLARAVEQGVPMGRALAALPPADQARPVSYNSRRRRNALRVYLEEERAYMGLDSTR